MNTFYRRLLLIVVPLVLALVVFPGQVSHASSNEAQMALDKGCATLIVHLHGNTLPTQECVLQKDTSLHPQAGVVPCSGQSQPFLDLWWDTNFQGQELCIQGVGGLNLNDYGWANQASSLYAESYGRLFDASGNYLGFGWKSRAADLGQYGWNDRAVFVNIEHGI